MTNEKDGYVLFNFNRDPGLERTVTNLLKIHNGRIPIEELASMLLKRYSHTPYTYLEDGDPLLQKLMSLHSLQRNLKAYPLRDGIVYEAIDDIVAQNAMILHQ